MDITSTGNFNNQFKRPNTSKPIVGHATITAYANNLSQAQAGADLVAGQAVELKTQASGTQAGSGLNPNVLVANTATSTIGGFVIESPNFVVIEGAQASKALKGQIVYVATIGSGVEVYVPCKASEFQGFAIGTQVYYDNTTGELTTTKGTNIALSVAVVSNVVDSIKAQADGTFAECQAVKIKL